ncbi:cupin domain-containing protein [Rehaibacterium terrae]|jgi:uncharacterized cupin superfamily protein|uniref:Putative cupin superfamily protein n=1 Tax=Rehaibacterium terrae TaxID=1341696 RepID=A0A7W7V8J4_9GAMM|nr:cupin domain-containing protein [Rehaibacterium terrae]MBB5014296.1 putative cupin superfamily protein [Rehaibacterium terrae]
MNRPILNIDEIEFEPWRHGKKYEARPGQIARRIGARKLGYGLAVLPPGKCAFPRHSHRVNEEMFFVLEGTGELRVGDARHPIRAGDAIACPPGGPETAHQIVNTGDSELKYLAVSTMQHPEIVEYPDSGKFGVRAIDDDAGGKPRVFRYNGRAEASLDYWDGED